MKTEFFSTRTLARNAAKGNGGKVIDNGTQSAPGKRWSVQIETLEVLSLPVKVGKLNRQATRTTYAYGKKDKPVSVLHKRSSIFPDAIQMHSYN